MKYSLMPAALLVFGAAGVSAQQTVNCNASSIQATAKQADSLDTPATILRTALPKYPAAQREAKIPGKVQLSFVVDTAGRAETCSILAKVTTPADSVFIRSAVDMILATVYRPGVKAGVPVRAVVTQNVNFTMDN